MLSIHVTLGCIRFDWADQNNFYMSETTCGVDIVHTWKSVSQYQGIQTKVGDVERHVQSKHALLLLNAGNLEHAFVFSYSRICWMLTCSFFQLKPWLWQHAFVAHVRTKDNLPHCHILRRKPAYARHLDLKFCISWEFSTQKVFHSRSLFKCLVCNACI